MTVAPQADTEVVVGIIQGIVQKGADKWQVEVNVGQQNPRRLWTKDAALVGQLSMMIGQQQSFLCGVSHWTNQQNQPVRSLWINGVGPAASVPQTPMAQQPVAPPPTAPMPQVPQQAPFPMPVPVQAQMPQPMQQPAPQQPQVVQMGPVGESRYLQERAVERPYIHRQTASKVAAILISHVPAEQRTLDNVLRLSEQLVAYYDQGIIPFAGVANPGGDGYPADPGPQGIPQTDDDIPF